jgi:hypothetical protein
MQTFPKNKHVPVVLHRHIVRGRDHLSESPFADIWMFCCSDSIDGGGSEHRSVECQIYLWTGTEAIQFKPE